MLLHVWGVGICVTYKCIAIYCNLTLDCAQGRMYTLPDVWIRPPFGGKGRKMTGQLEAHANGFRYTSPRGEQLDIMYRCAPPARGSELAVAGGAAQSRTSCSTIVCCTVRACALCFARFTAR